MIRSAPPATARPPTIDNGQLQVIAAHAIPEVVAATKFQYIVNSVTFKTTAGSIYPVVNFSVVDPTNNNAPYNILTAAAVRRHRSGYRRPGLRRRGTARLAIDIAWDTSDYTNWGSGATARQWGQPISLNPLSGCGTATPAPGLTGPDATGAFTHDFAHAAAAGAGGQLPARWRPPHAPPSPMSASSSKAIRASSPPVRARLRFP